MSSVVHSVPMEIIQVIFFNKQELVFPIEIP